MRWPSADQHTPVGNPSDESVRDFGPGVTL
jgi:hypothetical protein